MIILEGVLNGLNDTRQEQYRSFVLQGPSKLVYSIALWDKHVICMCEVTIQLLKAWMVYENVGHILSRRQKTTTGGEPGYVDKKSR
jgi:hypothetical protein